MIVFIKNSLYLDMPFEHSCSLFEILRMLVEMFGKEDFYEKATLIH